MLLLNIQDPHFPFRLFSVISCVSFSMAMMRRIRQHELHIESSTMKGDHEPWLPWLVIRLAIIFQMAAVFLYAFARLPLFLPLVHSPLIYTLRLLGIPLTFMGTLQVSRVLKQLGKNYSMSLHIKKDQQLVTSGVYQYVRHPMYTAIFMFYFGTFLMSWNVVLLLASVWIYVAIFTVRIPKEEKMMVQTFGAQYEEYCKRTGQVWPKQLSEIPAFLLS